VPGEHKWGGAAGEIRWSIVRKRIGYEWKFPMRASLLLTCVAALGILLPGIGAAAEPAPGANAAPAPPAPAPATTAYNTTDTDIGTLLDNPKTRAILDKYLPGFSKAEQIDQARNMTLKAVQPYAADTVTDEALAKIDADLAKLAAETH